GLENFAISDLALVRLGARGNGGDLNMADDRQMALELAQDIALGDADVIDIEHETNIGAAELGDDLGRFAHLRIEVIGLVARVERLEEERQAVRLGLGRGNLEILKKGLPRDGALGRCYDAR